MARIRGGRWIPPEGMRLLVVPDNDGPFLSENREFPVQQYIPPGSLIVVNGRRGTYCELTIHAKTTQTEIVVRFGGGELLPLAKIPPDAEIAVFRNGDD